MKRFFFTPPPARAFRRRKDLERHAPAVQLPALPDVWSVSKRRAFLLVSPLALLGCAAGILLQLPDVNPLDLWMLLVLGLTILVSAGLVLARRLPVERALIVVYTVGCAYFLAMLANQYHHNVGREERLTEATFWFPVLYCVAFLARWGGEECVLLLARARGGSGERGRAVAWRGGAARIRGSPARHREFQHCRAAPGGRGSKRCPATRGLGLVRREACWLQSGGARRC